MLQVNDTVRLITLKNAECEGYFGDNYLKKEETKPQVNDTFKILGILQIDGVTWLELHGLYFEHPACKFEKVELFEQPRNIFNPNL